MTKVPLPNGPLAGITLTALAGYDPDGVRAVITGCAAPAYIDVVRLAGSGRLHGLTCRIQRPCGRPTLWVPGDLPGRGKGKERPWPGRLRVTTRHNPGTTMLRGRSR